MSDTIRGFRNFRIYLLPAFLLASAGALLVALLYYPTPTAVTVAESQIAGEVAQSDGQTRAETLLAAMLADALREIQSERETQARTLMMYRYEQNSFSAERPALLRIAPPVGQNAVSGSSRSGLIQL